MEREPPFRYLAVCPKGIEGELHCELQALGLRADTFESFPGGLRFSGDLADGYRVAFASFLTSRVLVELARFDVSDQDDLYAALRSVPWTDHMQVTQSFRWDVASAASQQWIARKFALQRAKDALVDSFRAKFQSRPDVDRDAPDLCFHLFVGQREVALSVELGTDSLHKRGLRMHGVSRARAAAPLKEPLAAAVLRFGGWHLHQAGEHPPLLDPMCGSGTLLLEAVSMATEWVPGLRRGDDEPRGWLQHNASAWRELRDAFATKHEEASAQSVGLRLYGLDRSVEALDQARRVFRTLDAQGCAVHLKQGPVFRKASLEELVSPTEEPGLLVTNPPYGERLLERSAALALHETLGDRLRSELLGWRASVLTTHELVPCIGLRPEAKHPVYNGPIDCRIAIFAISTQAPKSSSPGWKKKSPGADMLLNRLRKKLKSLAPWAEEQATDCYRMYDRDIPEFPVTMDRLGETVVVYDRSRRDIDAAEELQRLRDIRISLEALIPGAEIVFKTRDGAKARERGSFEERSRVGEGRHLIRKRVRESGIDFWVNPQDYLDYGLFLDERKLRRRFQKASKAKDFLNLFSYTCAASVYAAQGGASSVVSVDLSSTYLAWGKENFLLNHLDNKKYSFCREDCFRFLERVSPGSFDIVYAGPPIGSVSKRGASFAIHEDGPRFLQLALRAVRNGGALYFSSPVPDIEPKNWRLGAKVQEITRETTPRDFAKSNGVRRSWRIIRSSDR